MSTEKLVRGKIPAIIRAKGEVCEVRVAKDKREAFAFMLKKLHEETDEFLVADHSHMLEELGDMTEAIFGFAELFGFTRDELLDAAAKKREERGDFSGLIIMKMK
jgi:predicted house-cleaning noncanonical NTP pyrophosphatase (MazG superfamily)